MTNRDFDNYSSLFNLMESTVLPPDLLIYLRSSIPNLVNQIHKRGRDYENSISIDYLSRLLMSAMKLGFMVMIKGLY